MARAIALAVSEDDHGEDLYAVLGQPVPRAGRASSSGFQTWRQDRLADFKAGVH